MARRQQRQDEGGRARLIRAARRLFTREGAAHVGINEVTDAAGVARMTLYNNFPSKEKLTVAVYEEMAERALSRLDALIGEGGDERQRVARLFAHFGRNADTPSFRGCSFIHASLQEKDPFSPVYKVVQAYKRALRGRLLDALDEGRRDRERLADQLVILLDGAVTEGYIKGIADPIGAAQDAALTLLGASSQRG